MSSTMDLAAAIARLRESAGPEIEGQKLEEALLKARESWKQKFEERIGTLPWWAISTLIHGGLVMAASLLFVAAPVPAARTGSAGRPKITGKIRGHQVVMIKAGEAGGKSKKRTDCKALADKRNVLP